MLLTLARAGRTTVFAGAAFLAGAFGSTAFDVAFFGAAAFFTVTFFAGTFLAASFFAAGFFAATFFAGAFFFAAAFTGFFDTGFRDVFAVEVFFAGPAVLRAVFFFEGATFFATRAATFRAGLVFFFEVVAFERRTAVRLAMCESFRNLDSVAISVVLSDAYRESDGAAEHR